jgi:hypothetical protein
VAVLPADLILPAGVLPAEWWEAGHLAVWIAGGESTVPAEATEEQADSITTAYAYWRAHEAKALSVLGSPDSVSLDGMGRMTSNGRFDRLMAQAEGYKAEWTAAVAVATPVEVGESVSVPPLASRSTLIVPTW